MFTNTKLALDIARNVSTIIKTFINIVAARHDTTIITVAARHVTTICTDAKFCVSKRNPTLQKFP